MLTTREPAKPPALPKPSMQPTATDSDLSPSVVAAILADRSERAGSSSSVHPEETSGERAPSLCRAAPLPDVVHERQRKRHQYWTRDRERVYAALAAANAAPSALESFANCGADAFLLRQKADQTQYKFGLNTCRSRWCQPCQRERAAVIQGNLQPLLASGELRFVTLTLKSGAEPLKLTLDRLYAAFKKLRASPLWKRTVTAGAAFTELHHRPEQRRWHVHLHILVRGAWIPQRELSQVWESCTAGSTIVDVRFVRSADAAAGYVCKYVSKPGGCLHTQDDATLAEAVRALRGRRMLLTFGDWRTAKLSKDRDAEVWEMLDWSAAFTVGLRTDDEHANAIRAYLRAFLAGEDVGTFTLTPRAPPADIGVDASLAF